jgi:hypothetical protein
MRSDASRFTEYVLLDINQANEKLSKAVWSINQVQQQFTSEKFEYVKQLMYESKEIDELKRNIADFEKLLNNHAD